MSKGEKEPTDTFNVCVRVYVCVWERGLGRVRKKKTVILSLQVAVGVWIAKVPRWDKDEMNI